MTMGRSILQSIMPGQTMGAAPAFPSQPAQNPMRRMASFMQAMNNPAAYLKQKFPDIPDQIQNDPSQILAYLQRTRGITDAEVQQIAQSMPWDKKY